jgi:hypothetical protein
MPQPFVAVRIRRVNDGVCSRFLVGQLKLQAYEKLRRSETGLALGVGELGADCRRGRGVVDLGERGSDSRGDGMKAARKCRYRVSFR